MLGRPISQTFPDKRPVGRDAPVVLSVRDLAGRGIGGVSFEVRAGEILGLAGLIGAGRTEIARAIFGADPSTGGRVEAGGATWTGPAGALRQGVAMIPESRASDGLMLGRPVRENASLASIGRLSRGGFVVRGAERSETQAALDRSGVAGDIERPAGTLSGGNQQKLLFARAMMSRPRVLIADEPTRGVDIGAKRSIYELIAALAAEGTAIILISSEIEEILGLAHRTLVIRSGVIAAELADEAMTEEAILQAAFAASGAA
jgi:simple sugar transport system ATP-binding protein/ribose transport system ATP-binding protein